MEARPLRLSGFLHDHTLHPDHLQAFAALAAVAEARRLDPCYLEVAP